MALGWLWWHAWFPFDAVGAAAVCVAGVALGDIDRHFAWQALGDIDRHFAWQAWHLWHWAGLVAPLVPVWRRGRRRCLRGRGGTWRH